MRTDSTISNTVSKAEELFAWQLGSLEALQDLLGRTHTDRSDIVYTIFKARQMLADTGAMLDKVEALLAVKAEPLSTNHCVPIVVQESDSFASQSVPCST